MHIEIFVNQNQPEHATNPENIGQRHLAMMIEKMEKTAPELGFEINPIMNDGGSIRFALTADPDGVPIELRE